MKQFLLRPGSAKENTLHTNLFGSATVTDGLDACSMSVSGQHFNDQRCIAIMHNLPLSQNMVLDMTHPAHQVQLNPTGSSFGLF